MPCVLIVDDHPSVRYLLGVLVESKTAFKVCGEAGDGAEAIEKAKQLQPDLILLDLSMPVMNGAEAVVILKRIMPQTKIIVFTMHADKVEKALAAAVGIDLLDLMLCTQDGLLKLDEHLNALLSAQSQPTQTDAIDLAS